ncbi:hypothetical protein SLS56_002763 [Neofusicoccum ribis]|uniref:Uncharacterized protein n=1 Tax=Neofusicoccum ribis TaxID=45134 RepID=A0ABR3T226_9PEZI
MIVGWCSSAQLFLGSELINYDNIHYSGAEDMDSHLKFVGGAIGFSQFGVGQLNVNFGVKDGKYHFQGNNGPYVEVLSRADDMRVTLYDNVEKRGWLVPASNVILHIAQARLRTGFLSAGNDSHFKLFSKDTSECTARESLLRDSNKMILEGYRVKDMILDIWSLFDSLLARKLLKDAAPGIEPRCTMQEMLYGFEFQNVIRKRSPFSLKCCRIAKTSGGWIDLIRDIDALVLFANGFEDLIKPSQGCQNLCHSWRSLPKGNDYLAVPVKMLKYLYNVAGCPLDQPRLPKPFSSREPGN